MLTPLPIEFRRKRRLRAAVAAVPVALELTAASYDAGGPWVRLTFDRPISIANLDSTQVLVDDAVAAGVRFRGGFAVLLDSQTVQIDLQDIGPPQFPEVRLTASADTGIEATDDGGTWAGVNALPLPYPP